MRRAFPSYQTYNVAPMYNQNTTPRYQQQVIQQQVQPQYQSVQYQPYNQRQYVSQAGAQPAVAVARPLAQYQQQQYMPAQQVQQQQHYAHAQYPQYQQRFLEQLQQVRPNDVSAYHAAQEQAVAQAAAQAAAVAAAMPQHQHPQQYVSQYRYPQYASAGATTGVNQQKEAQAALYALRQYQQQQQQQQQMQEQQLLAQQEEEEQLQQQSLLHNPNIQKRLLNQLYETFPPPASVTNEEKRDNYTFNQYYDFLQNQHEQILSDQQSQLQRYGNSAPSSPGSRYSPSSEVSSVRYSGRNSQYTFG